MATKKMLSYPKKPKASASITSKENYLKKVSEIDKENAKRKAENTKSANLTKRISGIKKKY